MRAREYHFLNVYTKEQGTYRLRLVSCVLVWLVFTALYWMVTEYLPLNVQVPLPLALGLSRKAVLMGRGGSKHRNFHVANANMPPSPHPPRVMPTPPQDSDTRDHFDDWRQTLPGLKAGHAVSQRLYPAHPRPIYCLVGRFAPLAEGKTPTLPLPRLFSTPLSAVLSAVRVAADPRRFPSGAVAGGRDQRQLSGPAHVYQGGDDLH